MRLSRSYPIEFVYVNIYSYICSMDKFKSFSPKVDSKRRLVLTRFYTGIRGENSFCYLIYRITKKNTIDKRFKYLFAYGDDNYGSVTEFHHAQSGEVVRVFKSSFKSVFKITDKLNVLEIWKSSQDKLLETFS
jgi:hypothetical protein